MHYLKDIKPHVDGRSCYGDGLEESNERRHQRWVKVGEGPHVVNAAQDEMFILSSGKAACDRDKAFLASAVPDALCSPKPRWCRWVGAAAPGWLRQLLWEMLQAGEGCWDAGVWDTTSSMALFCFSVASQGQRH